jgi:hypothetical protein
MSDEMARRWENFDPQKEAIAAAHSLSHMGYNLTRQVASMFLGALAFTVAIQWQHTVSAAITAWIPTDEKDAESKTLRYNITATIILTVGAVLVTALLGAIYGSSISSGITGYYGLQTG